MKKFWKILGLGALAVGLTPYKVEKNEETGEKSYQALLWRITSAPAGEDKKIDIGINLGEGTLTSKLMNAAERKDEPHLFSDELCVEYAGGEAVEATGAEEPEAPAEAEAPAAPEESAMPEEPAEPEEPKTE
ncbi:MAG: hypothetical protein HFF70_06490 [Oscillospiraceae bacterium]|jgi:hypothetical protein|nr:hypothetical protein [Oscillospiraceae bacterium]